MKETLNVHLLSHTLIPTDRRTDEQETKDQQHTKKMFRVKEKERIEFN